MSALSTAHVLHATDFAFPVVGMDAGADGSNKARDVCGTAFTIGGGNYLTAGHVWTAAKGFALQGIGHTSYENSEKVLLRKVVDAAVFDAVDLAVLTVGVSFGTTFAWNAKRAPLLDEVRAFGYPFGFDVTSQTLTMRAFQGQIVGGRNMHRFSAQPAAYEVSFPCPRGISGAPLIRRGETSEIVAVVLGNEITEMTVFSETETLIEAGQEKQLIKTEALHLGVAIRVSEILPLSCSLLGGTIEAWLLSHGIPVTT